MSEPEYEPEPLPEPELEIHQLQSILTRYFENLKNH